MAAVCTVIGVVVFGPVAARPASTALGAPTAALRGIAGSLARQNARRNPRRTAASASALMVGVAVVALFTTIGASLKASATQGIGQFLRADLIVNSGGYGAAPSGGGLSPRLAAGIARLPDVRLATGLSSGNVLLDGISQQVTAANPAALGQVVNLGITAGTLNPADAATIAVAKSAASTNHWRIGSTVSITYPDGASGRLRVSAIYTQTDIAGNYLITQHSWAAPFPAGHRRPDPDQIPPRRQHQRRQKSRRSARSRL